MKVSLKKASDLCRAATKLAEETLPSLEFRHAAYATTGVAEVAEEKVAAFQAAMARKIALHELIDALRTRIGRENSNCGISSLLTHRATVQRMEALLRRLVEKYEDSEDRSYGISSVDEAKDFVQSWQKAPAEERRGRTDTLTVTAADEKLVASLRAQLMDCRRQLRDDQEMLAARNLTNELVLEQSEVDLLRAEGIL